MTTRFSLQYSRLATRDSLFAIRYSLFAIRYSRLAMRDSLCGLAMRYALCAMRDSRVASRFGVLRLNRGGHGHAFGHDFVPVPLVKGEPRETIGVKTQDEFAIRAFGGVRRGVFAATAGERARRARRPRNVFVTNHFRRRVGDVFVKHFPSGVEFGPRVGFFLVPGGAFDGVGVFERRFRRRRRRRRGRRLRRKHVCVYVVERDVVF